MLLNMKKKVKKVFFLLNFYIFATPTKKVDF